MESMTLLRQMHKNPLSWDLEEVKKIVESKCDLEEKTWDGKTALMHAVIVGKQTVVEYLIESGANLNSQNDYGNTALHECVKENQLEIAKIVVKKGAVLELKTFNGSTPLSLSVRNEKIEFVSFLLKEGANPNTLMPQSVAEIPNNILIEAITLGNEELALEILKHGVDIEYKDATGKTALYHALNHQMYRVLDILLDKGANVNIADDKGKTNLMFTLYWAEIAEAKKLIEHGADLNIVTEQGKTIIDYIPKKEVYDFLGNYTEKMNDLVYGKYEELRLKYLMED